MRLFSLKIWAVLFPLLLISLFFWRSDQKDAGKIFPVSGTVSSADGGSIEEYSFHDVAEDATKHIVNISTRRMARRVPFRIGPKENSFLQPDFYTNILSDQLESSLGSGVLISEDGIVVTNNHVIEGAVEIQATIAGKRQYPVTVIGSDPGTDLAVLRLEGALAKNLTPIKFGNSDRVRVGDMVLAVGNPFALFRSVSMGIVSALQRANFGEVEYENFIQTDAAINPGNSGGAMVNMRGELIGINSAILSQTGGSVGVGFAIPSNMVQHVVQSILKNGRVIHGTLGVSIQKVDQDIIDAFRLPSDKGVIITDIVSNGPADRAGLRRGDVVLKLDDEDISRRNQFRNRIAFTGPGARVRLTVFRQGRTVALDATVGEQPPSGKKAPAALHPKPGGLVVADLNFDLRRQLGVPNEVHGKVIVMEVEPASAADVSGFNPGDIILEVNHQPVGSLSQYKDLYRSLKGNVVFLIRRPGGFFFRLLRNER